MAPQIVLAHQGHNEVAPALSTKGTFFSKKFKVESDYNGGSGWKYGLRLVRKYFYDLYFPSSSSIYIYIYISYIYIYR